MDTQTTRCNASLSGQNGCHGYVRTLKYGTDNIRLGIMTPYKGIPFNIEEIEKYVELLATIGFDIKLEKVIDNPETLAKDYSYLSASYGSMFRSKDKYLLFSLGENYVGNKSSIRYVALCLLRYLFMQHTYWVPRKFLDYYNYFKKKRIKPSLDKILVFANCSPAEDLYTTAETKINSGTYGLTSSQSCLYYGYYNFIGTQLSSSNVKTGTMLSTLLAAPNDFKLIKFMENHPINNANGMMVDVFGRTKVLNDNFQIEKELTALLSQKEYHKAYLYLKDKAIKVSKLTDDPFLTDKIKLNATECHSHSALRELTSFNDQQLKELLK